MKMDTTKNENKMTVLITGAAGGLGKAFAVECASRGWDLFLNDLQQVPLETLAAALRRSYGVQVATHACDLTDAAERDGLFEHARAEGWHFSMLINVAGVDFEGPFFDQSARQIQTIVRLNVEGTLAMTHAILAHRKPGETLHIINVASLAAFYPMPVKATYAASKRFLLDFSLALREEVRGLDATVTVLCPAGMPTNAECIDAIEAQGLAGQLTTRDVGRVADQTLNAALVGRAVVIPGAINRVVRSLGGMIPAPLVAGLINWRWSSVRQKRGLADAKV
jgi:short-subunit dehydrogenase